MPRLTRPTDKPVGAFLTPAPQPRPDDLELYKRPDYDGKELRPFDARPGAMDAFRLPSRGLR